MKNPKYHFQSDVIVPSPNLSFRLFHFHAHCFLYLPFIVCFWNSQVHSCHFQKMKKKESCKIQPLLIVPTTIFIRAIIIDITVLVACHNFNNVNQMKRKESCLDVGESGPSSLSKSDSPPGIQKFRFWKCNCSSVYRSVEITERLRLIHHTFYTVHWCLSYDHVSWSWIM